jgi:outer membrane protein TolC
MVYDRSIDEATVRLASSCDGAEWHWVPGEPVLGTGAEGELDAATDRLRRLAGLQGDFTLVEPPARHVDLRSADPYVATAATHNPDLQQREQALAAARGEERRRVGALYPTLGVRFDYQSLNHESLADQNDFWTLILGAQLPLFESGGARWLDVAEQRAVVDRLEAEVAGFRRDLAVDVRHAWITVRTLEAKRTAAEKALGLATESYHMLSDQYAAGTVTNLDVLTALTTLDDARANLAAIRFAHAVACVQLDRVAGTLGADEAVR